MSLRSVSRASQFRGGAPFVSYKPAVSSSLQSRPKRCSNGALPAGEMRTCSIHGSFPGVLCRSSFGIAFDIDGVVLRGRTPVGGSSQALRRLYDDYGVLKAPFVFLTNGGGIPESTRALDLSQLLGVNISPAQVLQGHSPFRNLLNRYENELIVATGKGNPALVMSEYGFKKVLSMDEYASCFDNIDPVSQYKTWASGDVFVPNSCHKDLGPKFDVFSERVQAAFVVSDPVDWGRDIQVLCDILRSAGLPGQSGRHQLPLYFAADDLEYQFEDYNSQISQGYPVQAAFPLERLGMGAFRIALESVFNRIHHQPLEYVSFGKPNPFVFDNAEMTLRQLAHSHCDVRGMDDGYRQSHSFSTLYMVGDNPSVDIKGARQAGHPWFSILTRTGVFKGEDNDTSFPADLVVDTVEEAVDYILSRQCS